MKKMKTDRSLSEFQTVGEIIAFLIRADIYSAIHIDSKIDPYDVLTGMRRINYQLAKIFGITLSDLPTREEYYQAVVEISGFFKDTTLSDDDKVQKIANVTQLLIDKYVSKYMSGSSLLEMPWMGTLQ